MNDDHPEQRSTFARDRARGLWLRFVLHGTGAATVITLVGVLVSACTFVARIDVCDRPAPAIAEANFRTEGSQITDGAQPLAPLASGGSFLVFTSVSDPVMEAHGPSSIRGTLLDPRGRSLHTCDQDGEYEYHHDDGARVDRPSVAMPSSSGVGLVTWRSGARIMGQFLSQSGCPAPIPTMPLPFEITGTTPCGPWTGFVSLSGPVVWEVAPSTYQVSWIEASLTALRGVICTRTVQPPNATTPTVGNFVPNSISPTGAPAVLVTPAEFPAVLRAAPLSGGHVAVAWLEAAATIAAQMVIVDDHLTRVGSQRTLASPARALGLGSDRFGLALAWDGAQLFAAWTEIVDASTTVLRTRVFDADGNPLRTALSPDGSAIRLFDSGPGLETNVGGAGLTAGGAVFFFERRSSTDAPIAQRLYVTAFDGAGARRFVDPACDATEFDIASGDRGRGRLPALASVGDGVTMAWTVDMSDTADRSGSALRAVGYGAHDLLPVR